MKLFRSLAAFAVLTFALVASASAAEYPILLSRVFTAAGTPGCTISGATVATPSVLTCTAAHNLLSGDQIQITGIVGTTTDNTLAYVSVLSSTTFALYSNSSLTTGITGTGTYTSGGQVTMAFDVSGFIAADKWALRARVENLTSSSNLLVALQFSADGFVSDIQDLAVFNLTGGSLTGCGAAPVCFAMVEYVFHDYQMPSSYVEVPNGRLRLFVEKISSGSATLSLFFEQ
jgi:hypothetical protein